MGWLRRIGGVFIRNTRAGGYFFTFFAFAIGAIVVLRAYLYLTDYPQVGGGGLHIAHMLWGGLLMLVALAILLGLLTASARRLAAIVGGIGFGLFIDELGKFITADNDYFFRPTYALIYLVFLGTYLGLQLVARRRPYSRQERLINALALIENAVAHDLGDQERERALRYIRESLKDDPAAEALVGLLDREDGGQRADLTVWVRRRLDRWYGWVVAHPAVERAALVILALQAIVYVGVMLWETSREWDNLGPLIGGGRGFYAWGGLACALTSAGFVALGALRFARSRPHAYHTFLRSQIIALLLVQFFMFYWFQLAALIGVLLNLASAQILNYASRREVERAGERGAAERTADGAQSAVSAGHAPRAHSSRSRRDR